MVEGNYDQGIDTNNTQIEVVPDEDLGQQNEDVSLNVDTEVKEETTESIDAKSVEDMSYEDIEKLLSKGRSEVASESVASTTDDKEVVKEEKDKENVNDLLKSETLTQTQKQKIQAWGEQKQKYIDEILRRGQARDSELDETKKKLEKTLEFIEGNLKETHLEDPVQFAKSSEALKETQNKINQIEVNKKTNIEFDKVRVAFAKEGINPTALTDEEIFQSAIGSGMSPSDFDKFRTNPMVFGSGFFVQTFKNGILAKAVKTILANAPKGQKVQKQVPQQQPQQQQPKQYKSLNNRYDGGFPSAINSRTQSGIASKNEPSSIDDLTNLSYDELVRLAKK